VAEVAHDRCPLCNAAGPETLPHLLLQCHVVSAQRERWLAPMIADVKNLLSLREPSDLEQATLLLGGVVPDVDLGDIRLVEWLSVPIDLTVLPIPGPIVPAVPVRCQAICWWPRSWIH
jgi:hypothetical protein